MAYWLLLVRAKMLQGVVHFWGLGQVALANR